jgi:hypothetical protein
MHAFAMGQPAPVSGGRANQFFGVEFIWQNGDGILRKSTFPASWSRRQANLILDFTVHRLQERIDRGRSPEESDVAQLYRAASAAACGHDQITP